MNLMTRATFLLASATVLALANAGCSDQASGRALPTPGGTGSSDTPAPTQPPTSGENGGSAALDALDPCALVTPAEVAQFGAQPGKRQDTSSGTRGCTWQILGGNGLFGVDLRNKQGLKDIVVDLGTPVDQSVGSHDGKILKDNHAPNSGKCMVSIAITESSRVDVVGQYKNDTAVACDRALKVAGLVEPRLPKGE